MKKGLSKKLNIMAVKDQQMRKIAEKTGVWKKEIDKENIKILKKIIKKGM